MNKFIEIVNDNNKRILLNIYSISDISPNINGWTINTEKMMKFDIGDYKIHMNNGEVYTIEKEIYEQLLKILKEIQEVQQIEQKSTPISEGHYELIKAMGR